ncbi:MAG: hypothetical protein LBD10_07510 [Desulfobulbus sp.]|jgi:hypothetical protein|uniref:hypothetical protein n=1 Tax=Desulfobulbus sp. TaxID=895 RepID=UPI00283BA4FE|nr:hypothetical protein [Desulfobulbus sp.]MDR2550025.1 hypothetical protein [Desulfobulbus sp.]
MKKNELLLLHGTVYGQAPIDSIALRYDCPFKSANIDRYGPPTDIPYLVTEPTPCPCCQLTDNTPIEFIHWSAPGCAGWTGMEWWEGCMTLLMRHV